MKLYARILLFFFGIIVFQAVFTAALILGLISRNNQISAKEELHQESSRVFEAYNSWVRVLWKSSVELIENLSEKQENTDNSDLRNKLAKTAYIESFLKDTGIDSFIIHWEDGEWNYYQLLTGSYLPITDFDGFISNRVHPYISLKFKDSMIILTSSFNIGNTEIFFVKHVDREFYDYLIGHGHSKVLITGDEKNFSRIGDNHEKFNGLLNSLNITKPYQEVFDKDMGGESYNISFRLVSSRKLNGETIPVYLAVFISDTSYKIILSEIWKIVSMVSIVTGILMMFVALYFSGRITKPINSLIIAMNSIRSGNYNVAVSEKAHGEIRDLLEGFNEMAGSLVENMHEITFLKDYNETIIHSLRAAIIVVDNKLNVEMVNGYFRECFSIDSSLAGRPLDSINTQLIDNKVCDQVNNVFTENLDSWSEIKRYNGKVWEIKLYPLILSKNGIPEKCVIELDDISRKVELEEKIFQAEKLSSLSFLSVGIAHEINNPLSSILINVQNVLSGNISDDERASLEWIEHETRRIAGIIRELLDFARISETKQASADVNTCVADVVNLTKYGINNNSEINLKFTPAGKLPKAVISPDELKQIVLNLIQNSVHAVNGKGYILIKTEEKKDSIEITIKDNGCGIASENLRRIFDPFFTTKSGGEGTGLGLSIVYGIVKKYGGSIDVESRENEGTTVKLNLQTAGEENI